MLCRNLTLSGSFDYVYLARQTPGYVGADLMALMREAATVAVNRWETDQLCCVAISSWCIGQKDLL